MPLDAKLNDSAKGMTQASTVRRRPSSSASRASKHKTAVCECFASSGTGSESCNITDMLARRRMNWRAFFIPRLTNVRKILATERVFWTPSETMLWTRSDTDRIFFGHGSKEWTRSKTIPGQGATHFLDTERKRTFLPANNHQAARNKKRSPACHPSAGE